MSTTKSDDTTALGAPSAWLTNLAQPPGAQTLSLASADGQKFACAIQAVLTLPANTSEQTARYGSPDRIPGLQGFFDASVALSVCAVKHGSPKALRALVAKEPNYLTTDAEPMDNWLSSLMWILQSTARTSFTIAEIFANTPAAAAGVSPADVIDGLKKLFAPVFDQMQSQSDALAASIGMLSTLDSDMKTDMDTMTKFTAKDSDLVKTIDQQIGDLKKEIDEYTSEARNAYNSMVEYSVAAGVTGVVTLVGIGVAAATGEVSPVAIGAEVSAAGFAAASSELISLSTDASSTYNSLLEKISADEVAEFQDLTLKNDLTAIDNICNFDLPSVSTTKYTLSTMQKNWAGSLKNLQNAIAQLTPHTLQNGPWLNPDSAISLHDSWAELSSAIDYFVSGGIVDSVLLQFGDSLPAQTAESTAGAYAEYLSGTAPMSDLTTYDLLPPGYPDTGLTYVMPASSSDSSIQADATTSDATAATTFSLLTKSWMQLQCYVAGAITMPTDKADFESRYGKFDDEDSVICCASALADVQKQSDQFGDPKSLRAALIADPNLLTTDTPPSKIYTHIVWLADKIESTSAIISSSYKTVYNLLKDEEPQQQVDDLCEFLFDPTIGPIPLSAKMATLTADLIKILGIFEAGLNNDNAIVQTYISNESTLEQEAKEKVGSLQADIESLNQQAEKAHDEYVKYCTAAGCVAAVCLLGPTIMVVAPIEGYLGYEATKFQQEYNTYCAKIAEEETELKQKNRFLGDVGGFNTMINKVGPALQCFLTSLQQVEGAWLTMNDQLVALSKSLTSETVSTSAFVSKVQTQGAVDAWDHVAQLANEYTSTSLIDYTPTQFGDPLPRS